MARRGRGEGGGGLLRELPLLVVLVLAAAGLVLGVVDRWRVGAVVLALAVLLAGTLRLLLPARRAGLLVVRSRRIDSAMLLGLAAALLALASSVPAP